MTHQEPLTSHTNHPAYTKASNPRSLYHHHTKSTLNYPIETTTSSRSTRNSLLEHLHTKTTTIPDHVQHHPTTPSAQRLDHRPRTPPLHPPRHKQKLLDRHRHSARPHCRQLPAKILPPQAPTPRRKRRLGRAPRPRHHRRPAARPQHPRHQRRDEQLFVRNLRSLELSSAV